MIAHTEHSSTDAMRRYVFAVTGKTAEELSALNPDDEIELATQINGSAPIWSREHKGSFRGRGNINIASRRLKTLDSVDRYLDSLVEHGARQY